MKKTILVSLALIGMLFSASLSAQDPMSVSGVRGNLLKRIISFGDFQTTKVKAIECGTNISIGIVEAGWATMKITFTQTSPSGEADVKASGDPNSKEYSQIANVLGLSSKVKSIYSGSITAPAQAWTFYVNAGAAPSDEECGKLLAADGTQISITGGDFTSVGDQMRNTLEFTYNFIKDGDSIAKVTTDNKGQVWIKEGLESDTQLVLAAISSALLARIGLGN